jgi:hypothetical protein
MAPLHRKFKQMQLRQVWLRDPTVFIAKYCEAVGSDDLDQPPHSEASITQMIESILDREEADLSTTKIMRAIAA